MVTIITIMKGYIATFADDFAAPCIWQKLQLSQQAGSGIVNLKPLRPAGPHGRYWRVQRLYLLRAALLAVPGPRSGKEAE
jgi:hypothetical protein